MARKVNMRNADAIASGEAMVGNGHPAVQAMYDRAFSARMAVGFYRSTGITPQVKAAADRPLLPGMMRLGGPMPAAAPAPQSNTRLLLKGVGKIALAAPVIATGAVESATRMHVLGIPTAAAGVGLLASGAHDIAVSRGMRPPSIPSPSTARGVAKIVAGAPTFATGAVESMLGMHTLGIPTMAAGVGMVASGWRDISGAHAAPPASGAFVSAHAAHVAATASAQHERHVGMVARMHEKLSEWKRTYHTGVKAGLTETVHAH